MKVVLTGGTGFIGRRLVQRFRQDEHQVYLLARHRPHDLPEDVLFSPWDSTRGEPPAESLAGAGAVIHLAGVPLAQRWTRERKRIIRSSRVDGTRFLVQALSTQSPRPSVLVCASGVGYYGSRGDEVLIETSRPGEGFVEDLCVAWEGAADLAESLGMRVVKLRTGLVLGSDGGALARMLPPFRMGVGGRLSSGRQWVSWIHLEDQVELILFALSESKLRGAVNAVSPNPVRNADFTRELAKTLHRPAIFPVPALALKILFGEMSQVVLSGQRTVPRAALDAGFRFRFPELGTALRDVVK